MAYLDSARAREWQRQYEMKDPERWKSLRAEWQRNHKAKCCAYSQKHRDRLKSEGKKVKRNRDKDRANQMRPEFIAARKARYRKNLAASLYGLAKQRAKRKGLPFAITKADIVVPELCPVLGTRLEVGNGHMCRNSPTLDRIIPELGYVPGNVAVISLRANTIKQDATPEELRTLAAWVENNRPIIEGVSYLGKAFA